MILAILLILITALWGSGSRGHQQQMLKVCQKNLGQIYVALEIFANEHQEAFPEWPAAQTAEEPLAVLVPRYTADTASFVCPGSKDGPLPAAEPFRHGKISYAYFMGRQLTNRQELLATDRQVNTLPKAQGQAVFSTTGKPPGSNHRQYGGNFLFVDGRCEQAPALAPFALTWTQNVVLLNPKP